MCINNVLLVCVFVCFLCLALFPHPAGFGSTMLDGPEEAGHLMQQKVCQLPGAALFINSSKLLPPLETVKMSTDKKVDSFREGEITTKYKLIQSSVMEGIYSRSALR